MISLDKYIFHSGGIRLMDKLFEIYKYQGKLQTSPEMEIIYAESGYRAAVILQRIISERLNAGIYISPIKHIAKPPIYNRIVLVSDDELDTQLSILGIDFPGIRHQLGNDGFRIGTTKKEEYRYIIVSGVGTRGIVYGVGAMLRSFRYYNDRIEVPWVCFDSTPVHEFRASFTASHYQDQGYKWWSVDQWRCYLEELQLWGANIAMYLPLQFGQRDEQVWTEGTVHARWWEPMRMLPELIKSMDMDVAIYLGLNDVFPSDFQKFPAAVGGDSVYNTIHIEQSTICPSAEGAADIILKRREELFSKLSYLDYVYVPTTDYGGCGCEKCRPYLVKQYLPLCRRIAEIMREYHPDAKFILSNQFVNEEGMRNVFLPYFASEEGSWADMLCFGGGFFKDNPGLAIMLKCLPAVRQKIVAYPEITMLDHWGSIGFTPLIRNYNYHLGYGLYPEDMVFGHPPEELIKPDVFFAPRAEPGIDMPTMGSAVMGAFTYSEGAYDDLTKVVWLANNWKPGIDSDQVALDYCRYYFGEEAAPAIYRLVKKLEERSVCRCLADLNILPWEGAINACYGSKLKEIVEEITTTASSADSSMPQWARDGWRWKSVLFRVIIERIGLAIEEQPSEMEWQSLKEEAIGLAHELYEDFGITTLSHMILDEDPLSVAVKPEWSGKMNREGLETIIQKGCEYKSKAIRKG